jgi:type II secretory pathway pseudopilin PulG
MTLTEVMIAMAIFSVTTLGVLGTFLSSRRNTEMQRQKAIVDTMVQGVLEQLKNRAPATLLPSPIPTAPGIAAGENCMTSMVNLKTYRDRGFTPPSVIVELNPDATAPVNTLLISPDSIFTDVSLINPGAIPFDGDLDNYGDLNGDGSDDVGMNLVRIDVKGTTGRDGSTADDFDDIGVYLMIWVKDYTLRSTAGASATTASRAIIINYTWRTRNGTQELRMRGTARTIHTPI